MAKQLDIGKSNPRLQCASCGQWKRLHGRDKDGAAIQRFYGGCSATGGGDHPFEGDVCANCCPAKCREALAEMSTTTETPGVARDERWDRWIMAARKRPIQTAECEI